MVGFEEKIRNTIVNVTKMAVFLCLGLDIFLLFFFYLSNDRETSPFWYIFRGVLLPFALNYAVWRVADHFNGKDKYSDETKKYAVTFMLCTIGGIMCIFHSYFTPLWCMPMLAALFSCIFCDKKLLKKLAIYCAVLSVAAMIISIVENLGQKKFYIQQGVIVSGMEALIVVIAFSLVKYTTEMVEKIGNSSKQLETDALTGLHSRPYIYEKAQTIVYTATKENPISVAILDLDHFKHVNDTYGHDNGDIVLRTFGRMILKYVNPKIIAGRFGGEEFLLLFDNMTSEEAYERLDEMRKEFGGISYEFSNENVTFSSGLVTITSPLPFKQLFTLADNALYRSKENGRNQITVNKFR